MSALTLPLHRNNCLYAMALLVSLFFANPAHGNDAASLASASHDADTHTGGADDRAEPLAGDEPAGEDHDREAADGNDQANDQQSDAESGAELSNDDGDSASQAP